MKARATKLGWVYQATDRKMGLTSTWRRWWVAVWVYDRRQLKGTGTGLRDGSRVVAVSQHGQRQDGSLSPLTLSVSLCTTLYSLSLSHLSLFVSPLPFSSSFSIRFSVCFRTTGLVGLLFSFFNFYMGWQTQWDGLGFLEGGWAKKKGAGPSLLLVFVFFFGKIYLLIFFFCWAQGGPGPP